LVGVLAQRLARQTGLVALLIGLCAWALLPLALLVGLGVGAFQVIRVVSRGANAAGGSLKPKTESAAGCGLLLLMVGCIGYFILLFLVIWIAILGTYAAVGALMVSWLARRADLASDRIAAQWGYGAGLATGLRKLDATAIHPHGWRQLFSTHSQVKVRFTQSAD